MTNFIDFAQLEKGFVIIVVLACVMIGYTIKHASIFKKVNNDDIPTILGVCGAALNLVVSGFSIESAVMGAFMGFASTGLHQMFKNYITKGRTEGASE